MSRTKLRLILLGLLALVVVGVIASTSGAEPPGASCLSVTTTPGYCITGAPLVSASAEVTGTSGGALLKATIGSVTSEIKCESGKSTGTIEGGAAGTIGKSKTKITFETCKLLAPANCKLTSAEETKIKTTELVGELQLVGGKILDKLEPKVGAFASVSIEGENSSCVIGEVGKPETYNVTGSQLCEVDSTKAEAETEAEKHKIICKNAGSSLKIGENKAEITDETMAVELGGAKAHAHWSVKET
jgi:hypothetical protein